MKRMFVFIRLFVDSCSANFCSESGCGGINNGRKGAEGRSFEFDGRIRDYKMDTTGTFLW